MRALLIPVFLVASLVIAPLLNFGDAAAHSITLNVLRFDVQMGGSPLVFLLVYGVLIGLTAIPRTPHRFDHRDRSMLRYEERQ